MLEGEGLQLESSDNIHKLLISEAERDDSGKYSIVATNSVGTAKKEAILVVGRAPSVKKINKNDTYIKGEEVKLEVLLDGEPAPIVTWTRNGQAIEVTERVTRIDTPGLVALAIQNCALEDGGSITMTAENVFGQVTIELTIVVLGKRLACQLFKLNSIFVCSIYLTIHIHVITQFSATSHN